MKDMAMAGRVRSGIPLLRRALTVETLSPSAAAEGSVIARSSILPAFTRTECMRSYASGPAAAEKKVKVPLTMFGVSGNYASALYLAAVRANVLDQVESELLSLVEAAKNSPVFSQFMRDPTVRADTRVKAMFDIAAQAKFSEITKNFLALVAEKGRLGNLVRVSQRFSELTMAHRGEVQAVVTSVIPLPPEEEKELKLTLQEILGQGKKVKLEQKIDPSILGGLVVEFDQKVFDMSIRTRARQMERFLRQSVNLDA